MLDRPVLRGKAFVYLLNSKLQISQSTLTSHVSDSWDRIMISSIRSVTVSTKFSENNSMYTHTHTHTHIPGVHTHIRRMDTHTSPHHIHRQEQAEDPFSTGTLRITVLLYLLIFNTCSSYDEKLGGSLAVPQQTQKDRASTWEKGTSWCGQQWGSWPSCPRLPPPLCSDWAADLVSHWPSGGVSEVFAKRAPGFS